MSDDKPADVCRRPAIRVLLTNGAYALLIVEDDVAWVAPLGTAELDRISWVRADIGLSSTQ